MIKKNNFCRINPHRSNGEKKKYSSVWVNFIQTERKTKVVVFFDDKLKQKVGIVSDDKVYVAYHEKENYKFLLRKCKKNQPGIKFNKCSCADLLCFDWEGYPIPGKWLNRAEIRVKAQLKKDALIINLGGSKI